MERIVEFDYLRGMAIAMIVLGHSIFIAQPDFPILLENLLRGGTGLFVFISGFFFHRVFYARFNYKQFLAKKFSALLIPFIVISMAALAIFILDFWQDGLSRQEILFKSWDTVRYGYVLYPHWYIPFILLIFLCSPLHIAYIRAGLPVQIIILVALSGIALLLHRPLLNANILQSLVYFTPYYLLGILFSLYQSQLRALHWPLLWLSLTVVIVSALLQTYVWVHIGNYHKAAFTYGGLDLQFIQILFGCIFTLSICRHINWHWLQAHLFWLAELSFPIFFIHPFFTFALQKLAIFPSLKHLFLVTDVSSSLILFMLVFVVQLYGSAGIALLIRKLFKDRSKLLIG